MHLTDNLITCSHNQYACICGLSGKIWWQTKRGNCNLVSTFVVRRSAIRIRAGQDRNSWFPFRYGSEPHKLPTNWTGTFLVRIGRYCLPIPFAKLLFDKLVSYKGISDASMVVFIKAQDLGEIQKHFRTQRILLQITTDVYIHKTTTNKREIILM